jgi:hypothetical protein
MAPSATPGSLILDWRTLPICGRSMQPYTRRFERANDSIGRVEVFTAVTMKNVVFWDVTPCFSRKNRRFGGTLLSLATDARCEDLVFLRSVHRLLVTARVPGSPILVTLINEGLSSSETLVLTRATWRNITEDGILHSHSCESLNSYIALTGWTL